MAGLDPFGLIDEEEDDGPVYRKVDSLANLDSFLEIKDRFADDDDLPKRSEEKLKEKELSPT